VSEKPLGACVVLSMSLHGYPNPEWVLHHFPISLDEYHRQRTIKFKGDTTKDAQGAEKRLTPVRLCFYMTLQLTNFTWFQEMTRHEKTRYLLVLIPLAMLLSACFGQAHHKLPAATVDVDAKSDWIDTGIRVVKGQTVFFRSEGAWAVAPHDERERWPDAGPEGHGNHPGEVVHRAGDHKKELPGTPFGTLLGRVSRHVFPIGIRNEIIMPASGTLYLVINDYPFYRHDNRGSLKVTISKE